MGNLRKRSIRIGVGEGEIETIPPRLRRVPGAAIAALAVLAVAVAALAIAVLPAEILFRVKHGSWYAQERAARTAPVEPDDFRLYRSHFPIAKAPGRMRILVIGGSTTYGLGVDAAQAWPRRLQARLEQSHPSRFEVIDVSYLGGHLEGFIADFERAARRYIPRDSWIGGSRPAAEDRAPWGWRQLDPDIVIAAPIVNDTAPDFLFMRAHGPVPGAALRLEHAIDSAPIVRDLAIGYYVRTLLLKVPRHDAAFDTGRAYRRIAASYTSALEHFVRLWRPTQHVILVGLPWLFNEGDTPKAVGLAMQVWGVSDRAELEDELSYFPHLERLEQAARAQVERELGRDRLTVVEIGRSIKAKPFAQRLRLYVDPVHATPQGHDLFAAEIYEVVVRASQRNP